MAITTLGYIRDYTITEDSQSRINVKATDTTQTAYTHMPTVEEVNDAFSLSKSYINGDEAFLNCTSLLLPPLLPPNYSSIQDIYNGCTSLLYAPVISNKNNGLHNVFINCSSLITPPSLGKLPNDSSLTVVYKTFSGCTNLGGEMAVQTINVNLVSDTFKDTVKPITLYGDKAICETLAATANNNNVSWSAWYDPITPVTNRGEGSRTTATDITRMIRNGVLAVPTYAPARMSLSSTDFLHEDEWLALVEAAQTIDNTITTSTHYTNLNKIEKAFDDAL